MPTAVEYAVMANPWHAQANLASGLPVPGHGTVLQASVLPGTTSGDWQLTGAFALPLLLVVIVAAVRRRATQRSALSETPVSLRR